MPLILPGNVASATADAGYTVANSLRLDYGGSEYLTRTVSSAGSNTKSTLSAWVKRGNLSIAENTLFGWTTDGTNFYNIKFGTSSDVLDIRWRNDTTQANYTTTEVFRDTSAWYHIVFAVDTAQATDTNRIKYYINGVQGSGLSGYPPQNQTVMINNSDCVVRIADSGFSNGYFDGYVAEAVHVDGQQLDPTSFGEFDEDSPTIWKPKDVSGLTFGTNGFYLDFEDSADLGNDVSGNDKDFTVNNLAATDQATDTPTNNFCTLNPLDNYYANATLSEGNLKMVSGSSRECSSTATIALSNGKWFWEYEVTTMSAPFGGIQPIPSFGNTASAAVLQTNGLGYLKTGKVETTDGSGGSTVLASYATYAANDIIGVALDLDAATNIIYFYKNGALQGSGVNLTHVDSTANGHYLIAFGAISGQDTFEINFGNPITALDSANTDANGYGAFEYAVPNGFYALCTKNLAEFG